ncbi:hypothetical protein BDW02DRAFT_492463 [Decorospora gaudefroyi]|uniref:DUF7730 domain-containing protein n=1 Tax=Decorospora gaudefroyi TaxID=184978 RepID=A0A6A5KMB2_9PLEO|nr:hypothetical protein BDW02DRAFT_492463 [Decorospora gaudefroyi]
MDPIISDSLPASPLLRLPFEIRLMIYEYLLLPSTTPSAGDGTSVANLVPDSSFHTYYSDDTNNDPFTLSVRTIDPWMGSQGSRMWRRRSTFHIRTGPFLTTTTPTTYCVLLSPYTAHLRHTIPSLLPLCQQIQAEASKILYSNYNFSFHTSIEAIVPFLSDLTPTSRSHVRHLSLTKKALPYTKEFDRAEWSRVCDFLAAPQVSLQSLHLHVVAGKPDAGYQAIVPIEGRDFDVMLRLRKEWLGGGADTGGVDLEWVEQLLRIGGLREVRVRALVERCARAVSEKQAFWVAFSRGVVEGAFGEWVRGRMVGPV